MDCLEELEQTQWWDQGKNKELQEKKLRALIKHAYENVPYYHKMFRENRLNPLDIRTTEDLMKLPVTTRDDVRRNFDDLIAKNYNPKKMRLASTGGTTAEPLRFYVPKDRGWGWGAFWRAFHWYGVEMGDKWAMIWSHPFEQTMIMKLRDKISRVLRRYIFLSAFELSEEKLNLFAYNIKKFKPKYLIAYPSAAYILSEYIKQQGIDEVKLKVVITTAEKLYDYQRETIKDVFGCKVFEYYGGGEVLSLAYECPEHHGLHITTENVILEFLMNGKPTSPGEMGSITVTDLYNYAMPFIRYENGDLGTLSDETCACGRGLPLMESVEGRITDVIVTKDGFISSPILTTIFKNLPVNQYQVIQEKEGDILIKIIKGDEYSHNYTY
jgi:phenylacetate-CoA ligase